MRLTRGNPYVAGAALLAFILAGIVAAASINLSFGLPLNLTLGWPPSQDYTLKAAFQDAAGLNKGANVVVAGNQIGQVTDVAVQGSQALVTMRIKRQYAPLHRGAVARIRYSTLLAEKYIELTPAAGTPTLASGAIIASDQTITPVDFDQFLSSLDPETRRQLQVLVQQLGGGVSGRRAAINDLLDQLAGLSVESLPTLALLQRRDPQLSSITSNLATASARLAQSHQQLGDLVAHAAVVNGTLAQNDTQLDSLLVHLASTSDDFDQTLQGNEGNLHQTVSRLDPFLVQLNDQLGTTIPYVQLSQQQLKDSFTYLTPYVNSAIAQQDASGNFLRQYVVIDLCYDSLNQTRSDPKSGCLVQAVSGVVNPAPNPPTPVRGGLPAPAPCATPTASPRPGLLPTPTASPCPAPSPSPSPCSPATPAPTKPTPSPSPTCQGSSGGGGGGGILPPLPPLPTLPPILKFLTGGGL
jgi:virulence factor Mce-like protein